MSQHAQCAFKTPALSSAWEPLYKDVVNRFQLKERHVVCGFDDTRDRWFEDLGGADARGAHVLWKGSGTLPQFLEQYAFDGTETGFDSLIYIPVVPPTDVQLVFVITLAHELQHCVQAGESERILAASNFLYRNLPFPDPTETWMIPAEHDAMVRSKHVAEDLLGPECVQQGVDALMSNGKGVEEWKYFQSLSASATRDWKQETVDLVRKLPDRILRLKECPQDINFSEIEWWK